MKKFIPPKTEEIKELAEEQQIKESSSADKWEKWGFTKKRNSSDEETNQKAEGASIKKQKYTFSDKSDIIISLDEKFAQPIEKREKTYEFRKYKLNEETKRMWIYVRQPVAKLLYIAEVEKAVEYPNQIPEDGLGNKDFNQGLKVSKFAYKINHLYKLVNPIDSKQLKSKYNISPPQKYVYVSGYPELINDIVIEEQIKIY